MHQHHRIISLGIALIAMAGCRAATQLIRVPRVDLKLEAGNRGYLVGTPPEAPILPSTREIVETIIELPGRSRAQSPDTVEPQSALPDESTGLTITHRSMRLIDQWTIGSGSAELAAGPQSIEAELAAISRDPETTLARDVK